MGAHTAIKPISRLTSAILQWPDYGIDHDHDAEQILIQHEKEKLKQQEAKPLPPTVDNIAFNAGIGADLELVKEGAEDGYYDVLLSIVDVQHGVWGINNFYKMQVIHDKVKDLYVLWTRWGRIGTTGQYQRTPFPTDGVPSQRTAMLITIINHHRLFTVIIRRPPSSHHDQHHHHHHHRASASSHHHHHLHHATNAIHMTITTITTQTTTIITTLVVHMTSMWLFNVTRLMLLQPMPKRSSARSSSLKREISGQRDANSNVCQRNIVWWTPTNE